MKKLLVAAALLCSALQGVAQPPQSTKEKRPSAANGEVVYMRAGCYTCHGTVGHGGAGARLTPNTLPLEAFEIWVRKGTPGWSTASGMPAFPPTIVSDEELADVRAYLASLPPPRAVQDIPLLNQ